MNTQVKSGKIVFLGGTPGNGLSKGWQTCEKPALNKSIQVVGTADTNWTRQGSLQAMSGFLSKYPDLKGVSYEYADGFIGGVQAYKAAKKPINLVLTLRDRRDGPVLPVEADQQPELQDLLLERRELPVAAGAHRGDDQAERREHVPTTVNVPLQPAAGDRSRPATPSIPAQASASTLVPNNVLNTMYHK